MQISLYWLNELLELRGYNLNFFIERLTVNGFEVEDCFPVISGKKTTIAIEISTTANRADILSIRGLARELKIIAERVKRIQITPPVVKVQKVRKYFYHTRWFKVRPPEEGGSVVRKKKRIKFNILPLNRKKLLYKRTKKLSINKFKWRVENTIFRSRRWKRNRLYYNEPVFNNNDPKIYSKFICWTVENLENLSSPKWLQKKLIYSGFVPENNLTDFQNYMLIETGYPFEFYDLEKIHLACKKNNFKLSLDSPGYKNFLAANGINYVLNHETLVIKANENLLSIAGIISNQQFSYTHETKSFLMEGSIFNSQMIRQQSRLLGLKTNRSNYYSKGGMNGDFLLEACYRLLLLLKISNLNIKSKLHTTSYSAQKEEQIYHIPYTVRYHHEEVIQTYDLWLREKKLLQVFGPAYNYNPITSRSRELTKKIRSTHVEYFFQRLKIKYRFSTRPGRKSSEFWPITYGEMPLPPIKYWKPPRFICKEGRYWVIYVPNYRREDIRREIDIIEEICRLYGVDRMASIMPKVHKLGIEDSSYQVRKKITICLLNEGFNELVSYSLVNNKENKHSFIKLINPLSKDYSGLRTTLLPNLVDIVKENIRQGNNTFEGFEYGHVFSKDFTGQYVETECLSGIFGGIKLKSEWSEKLNDLSWFEAKGKMEQIFEKLNLLVSWENNESEQNLNILHPYRTAKIYLSNKQLLGIFGQINPFLAKTLNIPLKFYLFEFNLKLLVSELDQCSNFIYRHYSFYPKIIKDLSFIVDKNVSFNSIENVIYSKGSNLLIEINLLDQYDGDLILDNQVSLCIQLVFQSFQRTLKNNEIDLIIDRISLTLKNKYKAIFRI